MLVYLDLVSCILSMFHLSCFLLWVCACWLLEPLCLFGCILSPFVACWMQSRVRVHLRNAGLLATCPSLLCLALHVRVSYVSLVCAL